MSLLCSLDRHDEALLVNFPYITLLVDRLVNCSDFTHFLLKTNRGRMMNSYMDSCYHTSLKRHAGLWMLLSSWGCNQVTIILTFSLLPSLKITSGTTLKLLGFPKTLCCIWSAVSYLISILWQVKKRMMPM